MKNRFIWLSVLLTGVLMFGLSLTAFGEIGVTDDEIVIGSHQDLSGPIAGWGVQVKLGLEMAVKEINDAGGIYGRKIRLIVEDSAYNPGQAIMVTNKMINRDKVFMFIGNMGSPTAGATKPIISRKKIPQMFPLTAASLFYEPYDRYSFGGFTPYYDQARILTKYFVQQKGKKKVGIMYQDDEMGSIMKKGVEDELKAMGMKLHAAESYKRGATVFSTQISKLKRADCDFVVLATVIRETVGALAEAKKLQWKVDMCGMSPAVTSYIPYLAKGAGFSADGFYGTGQSHYIYPDHPNPVARKFYKDYKKFYGKAPDQPSVAGYSDIYFFADVARLVGPDLTREKFIDTMETLRDFPDRMGGAPYTFTKKSHQGAYDAMLFVLKGGKWTFVDGPFRHKNPE
jgi:ABC-type branched-subunit amino acid transport system substrate-binding protein